MTTSKPPFPTSTVHIIRLCLFQPTRRPKMLDRTIGTPWGKARILGRLGQQHADVFEAICFEREKRGDLEDGRIKLLVDPAKVRRRAGITSGEQFEKIRRDLRMSDLRIFEPAHLSCEGHLIDHIDNAVKADGTPITRFNPLSLGERSLWRVELGKAFCKLVAGDIWVNYDLAKLTAMQHGISQAIARHALTHKTQPVGGWTRDGLIRAVAGEIGDQAMRDRRREVRADADGLARLGLILEGDRVLRVEQKPGRVEQKPGRVEQKPGAWSKSPALADTSSAPAEGAAA